MHISIARFCGTNKRACLFNCMYQKAKQDILSNILTLLIDLKRMSKFMKSTQLNVTLSINFLRAIPITIYHFLKKM